MRDPRRIQLGLLVAGIVLAIGLNLDVHLGGPIARWIDAPSAVRPRPGPRPPSPHGYLSTLTGEVVVIDAAGGRRVVRAGETIELWPDDRTMMFGDGSPEFSLVSRVGSDLAEAFGGW